VVNVKIDPEKMANFDENREIKQIVPSPITSQVG